jgi:hypothetical protein
MTTLTKRELKKVGTRKEVNLCVENVEKSATQSFVESLPTLGGMINENICTVSIPSHLNPVDSSHHFEV